MNKRVNLGYLNDILAYMEEGQYENIKPEGYRTYVQYYITEIYGQRSSQKQQEFRKNLFELLKYLLNNPSVDYEDIFLEGSGHGMGSQKKAQQVLVVIWDSFFGNKEWGDHSYLNSNFELVDEPFEG